MFTPEYLYQGLLRCYSVPGLSTIEYLYSVQSACIMLLFDPEEHSLILKLLSESIQLMLVDSKHISQNNIVPLKRLIG